LNPDLRTCSCLMTDIRSLQYSQSSKICSSLPRWPWQLWFTLSRASQNCFRHSEQSKQVLFSSTASQLMWYFILDITDIVSKFKKVYFTIFFIYYETWFRILYRRFFTLKKYYFYYNHYYFTSVKFNSLLDTKNSSTFFIITIFVTILVFKKWIHV